MRQVLGFLLIVGCLGCTDASRSSLGALGSKHRVTLYSGGQAVRVWTSTGKVVSGEHGNRFAFRDAATKSYVRVTGTVSVEEVVE